MSDGDYTLFTTANYPRLVMFIEDDEVVIKAFIEIESEDSEYDEVAELILTQRDAATIADLLRRYADTGRLLPGMAQRKQGVGE